MASLFLFLYRFRAFITLVILEIFCTFLLIQNNNYQRALFFNSSNRLTGNILELASDISSYFGLKQENSMLAFENAMLKEQLAQLEIINPSATNTDSINEFTFQTAEVVNNTVALRNNTLTIRIGSDEGVKPGMGVVGGGGIVGKIRYVSKKYSVVTSLLHTEGLVSATVKNKISLCTVQWSGNNPYQVGLLYIPRNYDINVGDTVMTSGYNAIFPEGMFIGIINEVTLSDEDPFYDITVKLGNDFRNLSFVHVIKNKSIQELDSLVQQINNE